ncbi:hypothetical protein GCM10023169_31630 [Georgenia halophila]|uniref:Uncharacterized protein n=1 Tax=Georgenia halophila TaxID=620889 RepID=A0ABP8LHE5_9MICO
MRRSSQPLEDWARNARLSRPIRWGEVEAEVFARRPPRAPDETTADRVIRAIGLVLTAIVAIPLIGASVVGLVLVLAGADPVLLRIVFVMAAGVPVAMLLAWWEDRDRGLVKLLVAGGSGLVSLVAYLVMRSAPGDQGDVAAALLMILAAVTGAAAAAVMLVASKPPERELRRPRTVNPWIGMRYYAARKKVMAILVERRLTDLDEDEQQRVLEMPLGSWHELDRSA